MIATTVTLSAATAGTPAVAAQFVMVGEQIIANGTIVTVVERLVSATYLPGQVVLLGKDIEGRPIRCDAKVDQFVELYDADQADAEFRALLLDLPSVRRAA